MVANKRVAFTEEEEESHINNVILYVGVVEVNITVYENLHCTT